MEPNRAFKQRRVAAGKKKCKHCGRIWEQSVRECLCGNTTRWISAIPEQTTQGFHIWECLECGYKKNISGGTMAGSVWLNSYPQCENCGHPNPGWNCLTG